MNASNRHLLAVALAAAMLSPEVAAQEVGKGPPDIPQTPPPDLPTPNSPEQTMREVHQPVAQTTEQAETTAPPPPPPPQSQGAEHAVSHSSGVGRDVWARLDTDGDGKISTSEAGADADFNTGFAAMDSDHDGFVTDVEYRTAAKADREEGREAADAQSTSSSGMGDVVHRLDANADGSISLSEGNADASFKANFAAMDGNSDGTVSRVEYQAWLRANRK